MGLVVDALPDGIEPHVDFLRNALVVSIAGLSEFDVVEQIVCQEFG